MSAATFAAPSSCAKKFRRYSKKAGKDSLLFKIEFVNYNKPILSKLVKQDSELTHSGV
jgi:hypothetical protein